MHNELTEKDKKEYKFLRNLLKKNNRTLEIKKQRTTLLDAIKEGKAELTGVSRIKNFQAGILGFLEREKGEREGEFFYFNRVFRINGLPYHLESLFELNQPSQPYAHLEPRSTDKVRHYQNEKKSSEEPT